MSLLLAVRLHRHKDFGVWWFMVVSIRYANNDTMYLKFMRHDKTVVLNQCETWSFIVREGHRLTVFENRVRAKTLGP
jgi:hypothetical protein